MPIPSDEDIIKQFIKDGKMTPNPQKLQKKLANKTPPPVLPNNLLQNLSPETQALLLLKDYPTEIIRLVSQELFAKKNQVAMIPYSRSDWPTTRQIEIIDAIQLGHLGVEGDRQTGKTISIFCGIMENIILNSVDWIFVASTMNTASELFKKVSNHSLCDYLKPFYVIQPTATKCAVRCMDGTIHSFTIVSTTTNGVKGCTGGIWFDETDSIIKNTPEVIGAGSALIRSNPNLHLIFSMNKGTGTYKLLLEKLQKWQFRGKLKFLLLEKKDSYLALQTEKDSNENDEFIGDIMEVAMGEDYALQQLKNEDRGTGDCFLYAAIQDAFETFDVLMAMHPHDDVRYMAVDPSGTVHKHGYFCGWWDMDKEEGGEIESGEIQMGEGTDGITTTPESLEQKIVDVAKRNHIKLACVESNSGGQRIRIRLRREGIACIMQNFKGDDSILSRDNFIKLTRYLLDERKIVLKNQKLKQELITYNPTVSGDEKFKGNIADSLIHWGWLALGGVKYLKKLMQAKMTVVSD